MDQKSSVSADGRWQWDGEQWLPLQEASGTHPAPLASVTAAEATLGPAGPTAVAAPVESAPAPPTMAQMATAVPPLGKRRNPFAIWLLSIITLGIYYLVWYGKINAEIRAHDPRIEVKPGIAVIALFVPLANLVSMYNTATRVQAMEIADNVPNQISPLVSFILLWFFAIGYIVQVQSHLNAHWMRHQLVPQRVGDGA